MRTNLGMIPIRMLLAFCRHVPSSICTATAKEGNIKVETVMFHKRPSTNQWGAQLLAGMAARALSHKPPQATA